MQRLNSLDHPKPILSHLAIDGRSKVDSVGSVLVTNISGLDGQDRARGIRHREIMINILALHRSSLYIT